jgi:hypothetical protein
MWFRWTRWSDAQWQNMMIPECQHSVECQLIEVMTMKVYLIQFDSIVNLISIKSMKVIHNNKNLMIREFQHSVEFQLIEVMSSQMPKIQFKSIMMAIQMWITEFFSIFGNSFQIILELTWESMCEDESIFMEFQWTLCQLNCPWQSSTQSKAIWFDFQSCYLVHQTKRHRWSWQLGDEVNSMYGEKVIWSLMIEREEKCRRPISEFMAVWPIKQPYLTLTFNPRTNISLLVSSLLFSSRLRFRNRLRCEAFSVKHEPLQTALFALGNPFKPFSE